MKPPLPSKTLTVVQKMSGKGPILLNEEVTVCPLCGKKTFNIKEYIYNTPGFGNILITVGICTSCGYKFRDVKLAEPGKPKQIIVRVESEKELRYMVLKPAYAAVIIPEQDLEMLPGPASQGFISTVEGVLYRFEEAVKIACSNIESSEQRKKCEELESWIRRAIDGLERFTLIICDYEGAGKVVGENVVEETLSGRCLEIKPDWLELKM